MFSLPVLGPGPRSWLGWWSPLPASDAPTTTPGRHKPNAHGIAHEPAPPAPKLPPGLFSRSIVVPALFSRSSPAFMTAGPVGLVNPREGSPTEIDATRAISKHHPGGQEIRATLRGKEMVTGGWRR